MTKLAILSIQEQQKFDSPPKFNADDRALHFSLTNDILKLIQELRSPTTKIGFMIQLGYFKANGKFYASEQFRRQDVDYIINLLKLDLETIDFSNYQKKILGDHRDRIVILLGWRPFKKEQRGKLTNISNVLLSDKYR